MSANNILFGNVVIAHGERRARIPVEVFRKIVPFFLSPLVAQFGQRGAAVEGIRLDFRHRFGNDKPRDLRAILKGRAGNGSDRNGNRNRARDRFRSEHDTRKITVANDPAHVPVIDVFRRNFHAFERVAADKAVAAQAVQHFTERYIFQIGAVGKGFAAERLKRRGEGNAFELRAVRKRLKAGCGQSLAQLDACKVGAPVERVIPDERDTVGQRDFGDRRIVLKGVRENRKDALAVPASSSVSVALWQLSHTAVLVPFVSQVASPFDL